ncbi:hypothetical protein [Hymenobacter cavernae]|uniref:Uncharacterized protein n=1 Tax=Hymenobacter cavernae TaxID=2044852 RepID=A0ABQ1U096_9BACT|nr:hypothetical protein [Hymenobacter cavernae]GGF08064.1 hypothetical protein GCM10011383_19000 [Hymenobacter cavernae]
MKINRKLNTFTYSEYVYLLEQYKKFTNFNTLGLFRSILENQKLDLEQKIQVRDLATAAFTTTFDFLQLKDPDTYFLLCNLGAELTVADERKAWDDIRFNQQRILASKKLRHRNFGTYSKHECGYETCHLKGLMLRPGSRLKYSEMHFCSDRSRYGAQAKSDTRKQERKTKKQLITRCLESE